MTDHVETPEYAGPNRRKRPNTIEEMEIYIEELFAAHEAREQEWIKKLKDEMQFAFPNGDLAGHRTFHERRIEAAKAEEEFWKAAKGEAIKNGVSGFFAIMRWIVILAILGLAYKVGLGPVVAKFLGVS